MRAAGAAVTLLAILAGADSLARQRFEQPFVPIGIVDDRPGDLGRDGFDEIRKLRFTVVTTRALLADQGGGRLVVPIVDPRSDTALPSPVAVPELHVLTIDDGSTGAVVRREAWMAIGRGQRGVVFDGWTSLRKNASAFDAAASFADVVTRNAALFAPLRPSSRTLRVEAAAERIFARFIESAEAMVLIAANLTAAEQQVTLAFEADVPEAIWQNMESGGAVNFVAGPEGPIYTRTFPPHDVVVLAIRKQYK